MCKINTRALTLVQITFALLVTTTQGSSSPTCPQGSMIDDGLSAVGIESPAIIPDSAFTASSFYVHRLASSTVAYSPQSARLNSKLHWAPVKMAGQRIDSFGGASTEWLRVDLGQELDVGAIDTQGSSPSDQHGFNHWTARFSISWSQNDVNYTNVMSNNTGVQIFEANTDASNSAVRNSFHPSFKARYVKVHVVGAIPWASLRMELYAKGLCKPCAAGTSSQVANSKVCQSCAPGTSAASFGSTSCTTCPPGRYDHDQSAATECAGCPHGSRMFSNPVPEGSLVKGFCHKSCQVCRSPPPICDFENNGAGGFCPGWSISGDTYGGVVYKKWTVGTHTPSSRTGPSLGGAGGSAHFAYFEATGPGSWSVSDRNSTLVLDAAHFIRNVDAMRFHYHMYGGQMGTLYVEEFAEGNWLPLWSRSGKQHNSGLAPWSVALVNFSTNATQVRFRAQRRDSGAWAGFGDMAVDDISFVDEEMARCRDDPLGTLANAKLSCPDIMTEFTCQDDLHTLNPAENRTSNAQVPLEPLSSQTSELGCGSPACETVYTGRWNAGNGITGWRVLDLRVHTDFPDNPNEVKPLRSGGFEMKHTGIRFGAVLDGFFVAPASGTYLFTTQSDDTSEVWVAPSPYMKPAALTQTAHLVKVVEQTANSAMPGGGKKIIGTRRIMLTQGLPYYIKGYMKQGQDGDGYFIIGMMVGSQSWHPIPTSMFVGYQPGWPALDLTTSTRSNICLSCAPGMYAADAAQVCMSCPAGRFDRDQDAATECVACAPGRYNSVKGAVACLGMCAPGTYTAEGASNAAACVPCSQGQFDDDANSSTPCTPCAPGRYGNLTGLLVCNGVCELGTHSAQGSANVADCIECGLGKADLDKNSATACEQCAPGKYSAIGNTNCTSCAAGQYNSFGGCGTFLVRSGPCTLSNGGRCVGRPNGHSINEHCVIEVSASTRIDSCPKFQTEENYDWLSLAGATCIGADKTGCYSGSTCPTGSPISPATPLQWISDFSITGSGWEICAPVCSSLADWLQGCAPCNVTGYHPEGGACVPVPCPTNAVGAGAGGTCTCPHPQMSGAVVWDAGSNKYVGECVKHTIVNVTTNSTFQSLSAIAPASASPYLVNKGAGGCSPYAPCGICEGDCNSDVDCRGELLCFHRGTGSSTRGGRSGISPSAYVPGCASPGAGIGGASGADQYTENYCYNASAPDKPAVPYWHAPKLGSRCAPTVSRIALLETLYCDRDFIFAKVPPALVGAAFIKTSNTDKVVNPSTSDYLCFAVDVPSNIYVLFNEQPTGKSPPPPPSWLTSQFQLMDPLTLVEYRDKRIKSFQMTGTVVEKEVWVSQFGPGRLCLGGNGGARDNFIVAATPKVNVTSRPWSPRSSCVDEPFKFYNQGLTFPAASMYSHPNENFALNRHVGASSDAHWNCSAMEAAGVCRGGDWDWNWGYWAKNTPTGYQFSLSFVRQGGGNSIFASQFTGLPSTTRNTGRHNFNRGRAADQACCCFGGGTTRPDVSTMSVAERKLEPRIGGAVRDHGCEIMDFGHVVNFGFQPQLRNCVEREHGYNTPECGFQAANCCPFYIDATGANQATADCEPMEQWMAEGNTWRPALPADRAAMVAVGKAFGSFNNRWDLTKDPCINHYNFGGVACDHSNSTGYARVFSISVTFDAGGVVPVGTMPEEIASLTALRVVWFYNQGQASGTLPSSLGMQQEDLRLLGIEGTLISGTLPDGLHNCRKLQLLQLSDRMSGTISSTGWSSWPHLKMFAAQGQMSGTLPPTLPSTLQTFDLSGSGLLSGTLPEHLGSSSHLLTFAVNGNLISGTIPASIVNNVRLRRLMLSDNMLAGTIPINISKLQDLDTLGLTGNAFESPLQHPNFTSLAIFFSKLEHLDLQMSQKYVNAGSATAQPQALKCAMYDTTPCKMTIAFDDQDALPVPLATQDMWIHVVKPADPDSTVWTESVATSAARIRGSLSKWSRPNEFVANSGRFLRHGNNKYSFDFPREWMPEVRNYYWVISVGPGLSSATYVSLQLITAFGGRPYVEMTPRVCTDPLATVTADGLRCECAPGSEIAADDQCRLCMAVGPNYATKQLLPTLHSGCRPCDTGTIPNVNQTGCVPCGPGTTPDARGGKCELCPKGQRRSLGMLSCQQCPRGTVASDDRTHCIVCPGGTQSDDIGEACVKCPEPLYSEAGGVCQGCPRFQRGDMTNRSQWDTLGAASCRCEDEFYNGSTIHVCFSDGFDEKQAAKTLQEHVRRKSAGVDCARCPVDVTNEHCVQCVDGTPPSNAAGFTMSKLANDRSSTRRSLMTGGTFEVEGQAVVLVAVFRCHQDIDIARVRCPAGNNDGSCAEGYSGVLCDTCADGYGMKPSRECETCEGTGYNWESLLILLGIFVGIAIVAYFSFKFWEAFTLKHLLRCMFQPMRILITYSQVTSQLGDVLDFTYPGFFGEVIDGLRPVMDVFGLLFRALGPSECFGIRSFGARWVLRVVGLPGILSAVCVAYYVFDRHSNGKKKATTMLKGNLFFVIFFCYPTVCIVSFAAFICRSVTHDTSVLEADGQVMCEDPSHRLLQGMSYGVVVVVAFGLPLLFAIVLVRSARAYSLDMADSYSTMAKQLSEEMQVEVSVANYVIRDVSIGQDYSFLIDAYLPSYLYWEAMDMLRKLILVGLVLLVGRGSIAQLCMAIVLSFGFFTLHMVTWPYKIKQDNILRATTEAHVFIVIMVALVLKQDLSFEDFQTGFYDGVLSTSFVILVPGAAFSAIVSKLRYVRKVLSRERDSKTSNAAHDRRLSFDLQALGLASDDDRRDLKRYIEGWYVRGKHAVFLSHFKDEAASEARILKLELVRSLRTKADRVFLDSDNLSDLRNLLQCVIESDAVMLLYTDGVLSRPWCLLELYTAAKHNVPIIVVRVDNTFAGDISKISNILDGLPAYLDSTNPTAQQTLQQEGANASEIASTIKSALITAASSALSFNPRQSSRVITAQTQQMAVELVDKACPDNQVLLADIREAELEPWAVSREYAVFIIHEQTMEIAYEHAVEVKEWLIANTDLDASEICLQGCDIDASVAHQSDTYAVKDSDCVLVIQTANVLKEPRPLSALYTAAINGREIVPVVLVASSDEQRAASYNFEQVKAILGSLSIHMTTPSADSLVATVGASLSTIGSKLMMLLPNVISKPLTMSGTYNEKEAQMFEIERSLRTACSACQVTEIHVRGIGVDGWDGTPNGKGAHESEPALKAIFKEYGQFVRASIRHRIEGPNGQWDPTTTPAADWPSDGSKNTSWAIVTMKTVADVDAALEATESGGVYAGSQLLTLTRFSKNVASSSNGAMPALRAQDQEGKKERRHSRTVGHLDSAQVDKICDAFRLIDVNADGGISREEIMSSVARDPTLGKLLGLESKTGDAQAFELGRIFQEMDADGNHSIDIEEFVHYFGTYKPSSTASEAPILPERELHDEERVPPSEKV